jgi:hypothetical protein
MTILRVSGSSVFELNFPASGKFCTLCLRRVAFSKLDWFQTVWAVHERRYDNLRGAVHAAPITERIVTHLTLTDRSLNDSFVITKAAASADVHGGEAQGCSAAACRSNVRFGDHLSTHRERGEAREEARPQEIKRNCQ